MLSQRMSERTQDTLFGFGAGVMLAACAFSLILPGLEAAKAYALELRDQALAALRPFDAAAEPLRDLARYIVERRH